ncbi:MAG: DMT family transporter [Kiritimatiellae bacterium]|nr:DMT family transporter [Kiritimatiellia bacterium]
MTWTTWILVSAVFLALYDVAKKASVRDNAVLPVLLISSITGTLVYAAVLAAAGGLASAVRLTPPQAAVVAIKSVIVGTSWLFTFCALRTLPVTIATPIRASAPALVFIAAFFLYGERPGVVQGLGMALVFAGYWAFAWAGRGEGIDFFRCRAVWLAIGGMAMSAVSGIWDKFVLQRCSIPVETVQLWFQAGIVVLYALFLLAGRAARHGGPRFEWRWTIPLTGTLLLASDWLYFHGLALPGVSVAAVSLLRRFSVVLTFVMGAIFFHERNLRRKGIALAAILAGVVLICL